MSAEQFNAIAGFVLLLISGGCAIGGWLTGIPDGPSRYSWRLTSMIALTGAQFFWLLNAHGFMWWVGLAITCYAMSLVASQWRKLEAARKIERLRALLIARGGVL